MLPVNQATLCTFLLWLTISDGDFISGDSTLDTFIPWILLSSKMEALLIQATTFTNLIGNYDE